MPYEDICKSNMLKDSILQDFQLISQRQLGKQIRQHEIPSNIYIESEPWTVENRGETG